MLQASLEAGLAFAQTRTTILHAVSFPLTSKFKIPHGLACAMLLPSFIRYYGQDLPKMQTLANQLGMKAPEDLAAAVGVSRQTINAIEKGEYNPTINLCRSICKVLGKTLDELFWEE